jgi:hypothetical protein
VVPDVALKEIWVEAEAGTEVLDDIAREVFDEI